MRIAAPTCCISEGDLALRPWNVFKDRLASHGIIILPYSNALDAFKEEHDAMLLDIWLDWDNKQHFIQEKILPVMDAYATYRATFPGTTQIIVNHTDMSRRPYATPYWRPGDPILYRTPSYDRSELAPFPPQHIWSFEKVWGGARFRNRDPGIPAYAAGFAGTDSGPRGYRQRVAAETARVGFGLCDTERRLTWNEYRKVMGNCEIIVCPRGWGEQSERHWDAWLSGKPVLTDRECASVEIIPGVELREGIDYLVYDNPEEIPDIVSYWTDGARREELKQIAGNGSRAARSYDPFANLLDFFHWVRDGVQGPAPVPVPPATTLKVRKRLLVTGASRSGARFISSLLNHIGIDIQTEQMGDDGIVSWSLAVDSLRVPWGVPKGIYTFEQVWHQVRHPLTAIASLQTMDSSSWEFARRHVPAMNEDDSLLLSCAKYWYYWNLETERIAEFRYRIEDVQTAWPEMLQRLGYPPDDPARDIISRVDTWNNIHDHRHDPVTWEILEELDETLAARIRDKARAYGYDDQPRPRITPPSGPGTIKLTPDRVILYVVDRVDDRVLHEYQRILDDCKGVYDVDLVYHGADDPGRPAVPVHRVDPAYFPTIGYRRVELPFSPADLDMAVLHYYNRARLYRHYWIVPDGIVYDGNWLEFFSAADSSVADLIAAELRPAARGADAGGEMLDLPPGVEQIAASLPVYRLSPAGMDALKKARRDWTGDCRLVIPTSLKLAGLELDEGPGETFYKLETLSRLSPFFAHDTRVDPLRPATLKAVDESAFELKTDDSHFLRLNPSAALVWELCCRKPTVGEIVDAIRDSFPAAGRSAEQDIHAALKALGDAGFVTLRPPG